MYAALLLFIVFGFMNGGSAGAVNTADTPYFAQGIMGFLMAVAVMSFTCNGASNIINLSSDSENPKKNIPLGVIISAIICSVIYFLLGYVSSNVVSYDMAATSTLGTIAQQVMPKSLYIFFVVGGAVFSASCGARF